MIVAKKMQLFNTHTFKIFITYFILLIIGISFLTQPPISVKTYFQTQERKIGVERFAMNIFCTELINNSDIKATTGSGVFLLDPENNKNIILTNAHVARHLLDIHKTCVGRTGNPVTTTHSLTLSYIPYAWLQDNFQYIEGDANKESTGEFDFAFIEAHILQEQVKQPFTLYDFFRPNLTFNLENYIDMSPDISIYSYPAEKTFTKDIYNPLYLKEDKVTVEKIYTSPIVQISNSLIDVSGSSFIDHGSSGGMVISKHMSNSLIGLSSVLIEANNPQIVRVVTLKHILSVLEMEKSLDNGKNIDKINSLIDIFKGRDKSKELKQLPVLSPFFQ